MRLLTFTTLYPNAVRPGHGIFVETRLRHLLRSGEVAARVLAPVPWFPFRHPFFGRYADAARTPREEERFGISVSHPRYLLLPKIGMTLAPDSLAWRAIRWARRLVRGGHDFDLIDAHYFYPDGVAAVIAARALGKPVVITARGTDINLIPRDRRARRRILDAALGADGIVAVCAALKDAMVDLGIPAERIEVLRNGVNLELFRPADREEERERLGLAWPTVLSAGHLIERKGHDLVILGLPSLPGVSLVIAGEGPEERRLRDLARSAGVSDRVRFLGAVPQRELARWYGAVDALVLASSREGWANVLLEAMACGTPVVATRVWGTPEVVSAPEAGLLADERTPEAIASAVRSLLAAPPDRAATRRYAEGFGWEPTTAGQLALFQRILGLHGGTGGRGE
jgi:glycosyltransferase involved in cell wall biosynthesis